jgi:hypothetical protein
MPTSTARPPTGAPAETQTPATPAPAEQVWCHRSGTVHRRDRVEAVLAGLLKVRIDRESAIAAADDIVVIPAAARRVEVVGTSSHSAKAVLRPVRR